MKFTAQITVEVDAESAANAEAHEQEIQALFQGFQNRFDNCRLEIRQKRIAGIARQRRRPARPRQTGNLAVYQA